MTTYKIIRFYFDDEHPDHKKVIKRGLSLEAAQAHCNDEATHEVDPETGYVVWFDGYDEEDHSYHQLIDGIHRYTAREGV